MYNSEEEKEEITNEISLIEDTIKQLTLDINKSQKIRGIALGMSTSLGLLNLIDAGIMDEQTAMIRIVTFAGGTIIYLICTKIGKYKDYQVNLLSQVKENIENENPWVRQKK